MPTILRFHGFNIVIYTDDHSPAHIHVVGNGGRGSSISVVTAATYLYETRSTCGHQTSPLLLDLLLKTGISCVKHGGPCTMTNDLLDDDALLVYEEPFKSLGFSFVAAQFDPATQRIHVELKNGLKIDFPRDASRAFNNASDADMSEIEVHGWAIIFPRLDEGFSLEPLAFGDFGNTPWDSAFLESMRAKREHLAVA